MYKILLIVSIFFFHDTDSRQIPDDPFKSFEISFFLNLKTYEHFNKSKDQVVTYLNTLIEKTNEFMTYFGIIFQITYIILSDKYDYLNYTNYNVKTLHEFRNFSEYVLSKHFKSDHYTLLFIDEENLNNDLLGNSLIGHMCKNSSVSTINIKNGLTASSSILAHELAHSLGVLHDKFNNNGCLDSNNICIMNPYHVNNFNYKYFSEKSLLEFDETKFECIKSIYKYIYIYQIERMSSTVDVHNLDIPVYIKVEKKLQKFQNTKEFVRLENLNKEKTKKNQKSQNINQNNFFYIPSYRTNIIYHV